MLKALITAAAMLAAGTAMAGMEMKPCETIQVWQDYLTARGQHLMDQMITVGDNKTPAFLWINPETGDWTILTDATGGYACFFGEGDNFPGVTP